MTNFIGIPFADGESTYNGANCYGLVYLYYRDVLGIEIPKLEVMSNHSKVVFATYLKQISENWIKIDAPEENCIVAMAIDINHPKIVQHFGVYIGGDKVLHTLNKINSHISKIADLNNSIKAYYKWCGN